MADDATKPERPRVEPEIIPPDRNRRGPGWDQPLWRSSGSDGRGGTQRIYITRVGPIGSGIMMLVFAVLFAVLLVAIIGTALIWLPLVIAAAVIAAVYRIWRAL